MIELIRTIEFKKDVFVDVVFDYSKEEAKTKDHPGSSPEYEIKQVKFYGTDIMPTVNEDDLEDLKEKLINEIES